MISPFIFYVPGYHSPTTGLDVTSIEMMVKKLKWV